MSTQVEWTTAVASPVGLDSRWRSKLVLLLAVATCRAVYAFDRVAPQITPDELAILGMGRWLSGGTWNMFAANTWRPGMSLVMWPLHVVSDNPELVYRGGLVINALIGGLGAVLLAELARRFTSLRGTALLFSAFAVSVLPAGLNASAHVWAEPLVTVSFLASVLSLSTFFVDGSLRSGFWAILASAGGFLAHGRLLPLLVVVTATVAIVLVAGRHLVPAIASVVLGVSSLVLIGLLCDWMWGSMYETVGDVNSASATLNRFSSPHRVLEAVFSQLWYLLVASAGVAGVGLVYLTRRIVTTERSAARTVAMIVLGAIVVMFGVSALFMSGRARADQLIYGRYNEAVFGPVLMAGIAWLAHVAPTMPTRELSRTLGGLAGLSVALGLLVWQLHGVALTGIGLVPEMVPGLLPALAVSPSLHAFPVTIAALIIGAVLVGVMRLASRPVLVGLSVVVLVVLGVVSRAPVDDRDLLGSSSNVAELRELLGAGGSVGFTFVPESVGPSLNELVQISFALTYQWYLPDITFERNFGPTDEVGPYVFAPSNEMLLVLSDAERVWTDDSRLMTLWREPSAATVDEVLRLLGTCGEWWSKVDTTAIPDVCAEARVLLGMP